MKLRFINFSLIIIFISFLALEHTAKITVVETSMPDVVELLEERAVSEVSSVDNLLILTDIFTHFDVTSLPQNHFVKGHYYSFTFNNNLFRPPIYL